MAKHHSGDEYLALADVLEVDIHLAGSDSFGAVRRGEVVLRASLRQFTLRTDDKGFYKKTLLDGLSAFIYPDPGFNTVDNTVICLPLRVKVSDDDGFFSVIEGLLLEPFCEAQGQYYRRGTFKVTQSVRQFQNKFGAELESSKTGNYMGTWTPPLPGAPLWHRYRISLV